jgi:hypothetical protein
VDGLSERARNQAQIHLIRRGADSGFVKQDTVQNKRADKHHQEKSQINVGYCLETFY